MIELIKHLLGLCPDHMTHLNAIDALFGTGLLAFAGGYFTRIKGVFSRKGGKSKSCCDREKKHE
jgi:hypothetical protein